MDRTAEKLWAAIVIDVQRIAQAAAQGSVADFRGAILSVGVHLLTEHPPYPSATWKKLVNDLKIPIKLITLCKDIHLQRPTSLTARDASIQALNTFLLKANHEDVLQPSTQLGATILQQIQQSGLLQHLADMMTNAAGELAPVTQSAASGVQPPDNTMSPASEAAGSSSTTTSKDSHNNRGLNSMQQSESLGYANHLLTLLSFICGMIPITDHKFSTVPVAAYAAAVELAYRGLQHISTVLPQVQQEQQRPHQGPPQQQQQDCWPKHVDAVWLSAGNSFFVSVLRLLTVIAIMEQAVSKLSVSGTPTVAELLEDSPDVEVPHLRPPRPLLRQQLLLSPHLLPAIAAMVAAITMLLAAKQGHCQVGSTSTSSNGSVKQSAQQMQLELSPAQLQLCDALGMSGQTLLWAAGAVNTRLQQGGTDVLRAMQMFSSVYWSVVTCYTHNALVSEEIPPVQLLQMAEIDLLLPSFVLPWLDSIPTSSPDWGMQIATGSVFCIKGYSDTRPLLGYPEALVPPPQELLVEVLPVVVRLGLTSLHQLQQIPASHGTEEQSSTGGAAASSLVGRRLATQCWTALHYWVMLLQGLLRSCSSKVAEQTVPSSSTSSSRVVGLPVLASQDVSRQHAADLITALEETVRHVVVPAPSHIDKALAQTAVAATASLCQGEEGQPAALPILVRAASPKSQTQQQLYSLLCSLEKLSGPANKRFVERVQGGDESFFASLRDTVAEAAMMLLVAPTTDAIAAFEAASTAADAAMLWFKQPVVPTAAVEEEVGSMVAAAANATAVGAVKAVYVLPSLVILGRCCLQWAQELEAEVPFLMQQSAEGLVEHLQQASTQFKASTMCCKKMGQMSRMEFFVLRVQQWLQAGSHSAELSAAGYATEAVLQHLEQLLDAVRGIQISSSSSSSSSGGGGGGGGGRKETPDAAVYAAVTKQLRSTGVALCALAVPCMCNYPGCTNMSGLTELGTVSGRSCVCGGCRVARYCSRACQKKHWKQHKPVCVALAASEGGCRAAAGVAVVPAAAPL